MSAPRGGGGGGAHGYGEYIVALCMQPRQRNLAGRGAVASGDLFHLVYQLQVLVKILWAEPRHCIKHICQAACWPVGESQRMKMQKTPSIR